MTPLNITINIKVGQNSLYASRGATPIISIESTNLSENPTAMKLLCDSITEHVIQIIKETMRA